jgi:Family of unknown function (DUF5317)
MILAATLGLALGLGMLSGGRVRLLEHVHIRGETALVCLLVLQLLTPALAPILSLPRAVALSVWCIELAAAGGICLWNLRLRGMPLAGMGLFLNAVVVGANLGMPVDAGAYSRWSGGAPLALAASDQLHVLLGPSTRLPFLADILAFSAPRPLASLVSAGDVLLLVGVAVLLSSGVVGEHLRHGGSAVPDGSVMNVGMRRP